MQTDRAIFWLHIKKSGGQSTRLHLEPLYKTVDRSGNFSCFSRYHEEFHNDVLNNYRVPLGEYQFRRCLFAKKYLYGGSYDNLFKFCFVRDPIDRCISQFHYLWHRRFNLGLAGMLTRFKLLGSNAKRLNFFRPTHYDFDCFLDAIHIARESESVRSPFNLHFQTHTAAVMPDITDDSGNILLDRVWRLENLHPAINQIRLSKDLPKIQFSEFNLVNKSVEKAKILPTKSQKIKIEKLFLGDFDLYDSAD